MSSQKFEPVIGLEVHVQLKTKTKIFCGCANGFGAPENTQICPVCLGLPGSLPVLNAEALRSAVKAGLALGCTVRPFTKFDRKNYFYPDLPKNFQISQYDLPLAEHGRMAIKGGNVSKEVRIRRVHLEEDAGKLLHPEGSGSSLVDFNRCGAPLLEIVSEPDIFSPEEAYIYLTGLKLLLQYLGVSDCDMEKGTLRCDANISMRPAGTRGLGTKTELKNMNSFKAVRAGLEFEISRQTGALEAGEPLTQETRLWDEESQTTRSMRSKEEAHDYRYFPEPDLPPFTFTAADIEKLRQELPKLLPLEREKQFCADYGLAQKEAALLVGTKYMADFFEEGVRLYKEPKKIAHWLMGPVLAQSNAQGVACDRLALTPASLIELIRLVDDGVISHLVGKDVLVRMLASGKGPAQIVKEKNLAQMSGEEALAAIVDEVLKSNEKTAAEYRQGNTKALMFLVGQVMRSSQGKANPKVAQELLKKRLTL